MSRARDFARGPQLRKYAVTLANGEERRVYAHFCFNNSEDGRGLVFRRYVDDDTNNRTYVVAEYAMGFWASYEELL